MAAFNPSPGGVPSPNMSDQTGASRGAIPNRAFESLFEGAGALVKGAVTAYDDLNKYNITEEVKAGWGKVNEPFDTDTLPKDLTDSAEVLKSLQTARDQGKLSDVYYTGQLAALSKKLRTQYPQYDQYIDQTFQQITGIKPANAFRNALLSDLEAQQATAADAEKAKQQWIKDNGPEIMNTNPAFFENPDAYDFDMIQQSVYAYKAESMAVDKASNELDYNLKLGNATDEQTIEVASQQLSHIVDVRINSTANGLSVKGSNLLDQITEMGKDGYTPEEAQQLGTYLTQLRAQVTAEVDAAMNAGFESDPDKRSFNDMLDPVKTKQLKERALEPLENLIKFAYDENWGMFTYALNQNKLMKDTEVSRILKSSPEARHANALKEINGELANMYITDPGIKGTILAQSTPELMAGVALGTRSWGDVVKQMADSRKDAATKAGGINAMIDLGQGTILSGAASDIEFANVVKSMYASDEDGKAIFGYITKEEYPALYNRMFNKAVTQKILESDDQDLIELYYESAQEAFRGNPQFKAAAGNLQADASFTKDLLAPIQFSFNPDFNRFIVSRSEEPASFAGMDYQESENFLETKMMMANKTIETLNAGLDSLAPILDGIGLSPEEKTAEVKRLITNLNIDLEGGDFGLFGELANAMANTTEDAGSDPAKVTVPEDFSFNLKEANAASSETITSTIMGFEGYRDTAYWDVNSYRTGFGSDTITSADGTVSKVTPGSQITREDAHRDLARRLNEEFIPEIQQDIGVDTWGSLSESTQAALASIAYNYGSLPAKVSRAAKSGDLEALRQAILALQGQNGGINDARRAKEASMIN